MDEIRNNYVTACECYVSEWLYKHDFHEDGELYDWYWAGDEVGGIVCVSDYFAKFLDVVYDIDNEVPADVWMDYYDYIVETEHSVNYKSYVKGLR